MTRASLLLAALVVVLVAQSPPAAQAPDAARQSSLEQTASLAPFSTDHDPNLSDNRGLVGLGLALRKLKTVGIFMQTTAHPDDENNALLAMMSRGMGVRTVLVTATRGDGGQNEIGPELFDALAVLRTEELLAAHRLDGAEQYFTRAVDFGFSFGIEETFEKWGRQEILGDFVRWIRTIRPDVVVTLRPDGQSGGQHHQASAVISAQAFREAGDPSKFPDQIKEGLRPWQPRKLYQMASFGFPGEREASGPDVISMDFDVYDPLLGRSWAEIGIQARSMHKCQGTSQLLPLPGRLAFQYRLVDATLPRGTGTQFFDGIDTSLASLRSYAPGKAPDSLSAGLAAIARQVDDADAAFRTNRAADLARSLVSGLGALRRLRADLRTMEIGEQARFEIDTRLGQKERELQEAVAMAWGLRLEALADDGLVAPEQSIATTVVVSNRGSEPVSLAGLRFNGFGGAATGSCAVEGARKIDARGVLRCDATLSIAAGPPARRPYFSRPPETARYTFDADAPFGAPFRPTPFSATFDLDAGAERLSFEIPVLYRDGNNLFSGERRLELAVVPRFAVQVTPQIVIVPTTAPPPSARLKPGTTTEAAQARAGRTARGRELRVTVTNGARGPASGAVSLELPVGWTANPRTAPITFSRGEDEAQTVRFTIEPPAGVKPGDYRVGAVLQADGQQFRSGYQIVEYPHITRRLLDLPAVTRLKVIDVKVAPGLTVGYIMGVGDEVPPAIEQLGARVELIGPDELAWGNLSRYDVIITGVRAYERRQDLRAHNNRLIEYAERGGTVLVQYNKFEFNEAPYAPYPAKVSSNRVTDEHAPVTPLVPDHPVFNVPNRIGPETWRGWVQERGLYFLGEKDQRYVDLVKLEDPFPSNKGEKRGALVDAKIGKGRWIYIGLGLWRQLPAGTDGAYRLLANLISLPKAS
ncbi:MAG: PIG-L family deacetylase [Acidobacteria bacterium]|nr:PIG-L family deacetylase [Acidobacteriota bacterium]